MDRFAKFTIDDFMSNRNIYKNTKAGVVALISVTTLGDYLSTYSNTYNYYSIIHNLSGVTINALTDGSFPSRNWARGATVSISKTAPDDLNYSWSDVYNVSDYADWLIITDIKYYMGDSLPRTANSSYLPHCVISGANVISYTTSSSPWQLYSVSTPEGGVIIRFAPIARGVLTNCYINEYQEYDTLGWFDIFNTPLICVGGVRKNMFDSPTTYTAVDCEVFAAPYNSRNILLHNHAEGEIFNDYYGGSALTNSGKWYAGIRATAYKAEQGLSIYKDMQSIVDMFSDWGLVVTTDKSIAESFPTSQIPSEDGQPPAGYDTNDTPNIDSYPDNSTVDFEVKKPLVNYNPAIDTNVMTAQSAGMLLNWLTTSSFLDNISRLFNEPLSAIIALRYYPFDITQHDGANVEQTSNITIVNVTCDTVGGYKLGDNYNTTVSGGSMEYTAYYGSYADWTNCRYQLYIPYVGIVDIAPSYVINRRLTIEYVVDFLSGKTTAIVKSYDKDTNKGNIVLMRECSLSVDVPIVYSNYNQQQLTRTLSLLSGVQSVANGAINGAMSGGGTGAAIGAVTGLLGGAASAAQTYATTPLEMGAIGTIGSSGGYNMPQTAYLMISRRPLALPAAEYANIAGKSAGVYDTIGAVSGFVKCECARVDINATEREKQEIMSLLASGVYV